MSPKGDASRVTRHQHASPNPQNGGDASTVTFAQVVTHVTRTPNKGKKPKGDAMTRVTRYIKVHSIRARTHLRNSDEHRATRHRVIASPAGHQ